MKDRHKLGPLLDRVHAGDAKALDALLAKIRPYLRLLVRQQLDHDLRHELGDSDIVQETLMRIHHGLDPAAKAQGHFHGQHVPQLLGWVGQIVRHVIIDMERRDMADKRDKGREVSGSKVLALVSQGSSPEQRAERAEAAVLLAEALARLPQHQQDVLHWRFFERLSFEEISQRTGKSVGALRVVCSRALERLGQDDQLRQAKEACS